MIANPRLFHHALVKNAFPSLKICIRRYCMDVKGAASVPKLAKLSDRAILRIKGKDSAKFLQGIITNDVNHMKEEAHKSLYTMLLNSQGRILFDALLYSVPDATEEYFLESDAEAVDGILKHLKMYRLRAKVEIEDASKDVDSWVLFSGDDNIDVDTINDKNILAMKDPRLESLGLRIIVPWNQSPVNLLKVGEHIPVGTAVYKEHRYKQGVAEGLGEMPSGNSLPLEYNLALINGVSFSKGCYIGQELTARTHHVGQIRKRIMPLQLIVEEKIKHYPEFAPGSPIKTDSGKSAGRLAVMSGQYGLGLIRQKELSESSYLVVMDVNGKEVHATAARPRWWPDTA